MRTRQPRGRHVHHLVTMTMASGCGFADQLVMLQFRLVHQLTWVSSATPHQHGNLLLPMQALGATCRRTWSRPKPPHILVTGSKLAEADTQAQRHIHVSVKDSSHLQQFQVQQACMECLARMGPTQAIQATQAHPVLPVCLACPACLAPQVCPAPPACLECLECLAEGEA